MRRLLCFLILSAAAALAQSQATNTGDVGGLMNGGVPNPMSRTDGQITAGCGLNGAGVCPTSTAAPSIFNGANAGCGTGFVDPDTGNFVVRVTCDQDSSNHAAWLVPSSAENWAANSDTTHQVIAISSASGTMFMQFFPGRRPAALHRTVPAVPFSGSMRPVPTASPPTPPATPSATRPSSGARFS